MKKEYAIIANALVRGIVMIACSIALKDVGLFQDIQLVLGGGAVGSLLVAATAGLRKESYGRKT